MTPHYPSYIHALPLLLPFLFLFLLPTLFATPVLDATAARVELQELSDCLKSPTPNDYYLVNESAPVQSPLLLNYRVSSAGKSATVFDVLVMSKMEHAKWVQGGRKGRGVVRKDLSMLDHKLEKVGGFYSFERSNVEFWEKGAYVLVIRAKTVGGKEDCRPRIKYTFEPRPPKCPPLVFGGANLASGLAKKSTSSLVEDRVVGGETVTNARVQAFMVHIQMPGGICTGVVVHQRYVLTAAHCDLQTTGYVRIGGSNVRNGQQFGVARVLRHPGYTPISRTAIARNDVALLELKTLVKPPQPIGINRNRAFPSDDVPATTAGYGYIAENWSGLEGVPRSLLTVDVPIVAIPRCRGLVSNEDKPIANSLTPDIHMCAGYAEGGCDSCQGDSGGPLFVRDTDGSPLLVGTVSTGIGCASSSSPGSYTRISTFADWIEKTVSSGPGGGAQASSTNATAASASVNSSNLKG